MLDAYWHASSINAYQVVWAYAISIAFEGHICLWHIVCNSTVNECCSLLTFDGYVQ